MLVDLTIDIVVKWYLSVQYTNATIGYTTQQKNKQNTT